MRPPCGACPARWADSRLRAHHSQHEGTSPLTIPSRPELFRFTTRISFHLGCLAGAGVTVTRTIFRYGKLHLSPGFANGFVTLVGGGQSCAPLCGYRSPPSRGRGLGLLGPLSSKMPVGVFETAPAAKYRRPSGLNIRRLLLTAPQAGQPGRRSPATQLLAKAPPGAWAAASRLRPLRGGHTRSDASVSSTPPAGSGPAL